MSDILATAERASILKSQPFRSGLPSLVMRKAWKNWEDQDHRVRFVRRWCIFVDQRGFDIEGTGEEVDSLAAVRTGKDRK